MSSMTPYNDHPRGWPGRHNGMSLFDRFERSLWDPFRASNDFWDEGPMRSFFKDAHAVAGTRVDWKETKDAHVFKADLPGLTKEDVKVTVDDGQVLRISGERSKEKEEKGDTWHRVERSHGSFVRQFRLPENANADQVQAKVENGVLSVTVPKRQVTENPRHRNIEIK